MNKFLALLGFDPAKHSVKVEMMAGLTTFLTMSYILAVNPLILSDAGMDKGAVFSATVIAAATTSALFLVGVMMLRSIVHIDFIDFAEAMPCFVTMLMMPFTASISEGIVLGMLSYVLVYVCTGRYRSLTPTIYILSAFFVLKYIAPLL